MTVGPFSVIVYLELADREIERDREILDREREYLQAVEKADALPDAALFPEIDVDRVKLSH